MKRLVFVTGSILMGIGLLVSLGTVLMMLDKPFKFTPLMNLEFWSLAGLLPFVIGVVLWLRSEEMRWNKAMWFFIGFILSWITWSGTSYVRLRPKDLTKKMPDSFRSFYNKESTWVKSAIPRHIGRFYFIAASDGSTSAWIKPRDTQFPFMIIDGKGTNRLAQQITLVGNRGQSISVDVATDGAFSAYTVSTGDMFDSNSLSMVDSDMDGQYDIRIGPGRHVDLWINSTWHERIFTNGHFYVLLDGVETEVMKTNGIWEVKK